MESSLALVVTGAPAGVGFHSKSAVMPQLDTRPLAIAP